MKVKVALPLPRDVFCVTFEKVHWNIAGAVGIADVLAIRSSLVRGRSAARCRARRRRARFFAAFLLVYLLGFFNLETAQGSTSSRRGW